MISRAQIRFLSVLLLSAAIPAGAARAEKTRAPLETGMTVGDVLTRWGEPADKVEHETRRTMVWSYPAGKVIFQQGKLVVFPSAEPEDQDRPANTAVAAKSVKPEPPAENAGTGSHRGEDIISEVLREVPSDDDKGVSSRPGGPPQTGGPSLIRPLPGSLPPAAVSDPEE